MTTPYNSRPAQPTLGLHETGPVATVSAYEFEPIRGYPMLQWAGKRPFRSTHYYPAQHKETYGPEVDGWRNKLYWGDNLQVMSHLLKNYRGQVQLIYIDPPFDSKADYTRKITVRGQSAQSDKSAFEDKQYRDIWTNDMFLQFMYERLILLRELLTADGSVFVHVGWQRSSYIRCMLDEIFGSAHLLNEIIWQRTPHGGSSKARSNRFPVNHDSIFWYGKSEGYTYHTQFVPYDEDYIERFTNPDNDPRGPWQSVSLKTYSQETFDRLQKEGMLIPPQREGAGWRYKWYLADTKGKQIEDIWTDVSAVNSMATERVDYPTQKPGPLLERIIRAASNPGDLVFDCFMGSGTTPAVAMKLGRRFLGADINLDAVQITTKRLLTVATDIQAQSQPKSSQPSLLPATDEESEGQPTTHYTGLEVYNVNNYDVFRNPIQARDLLIEALELEPMSAGSLYDGQRDGRMWKIMPVNRIATREDLNDLTSNFDYKAFQRRQQDAPNKPVEKITLVCMGHEPDLGLHLRTQTQPYLLDVEVLDILRDRQDIQFKRDSEAQVTLRDSVLTIEQFWPMTLLSKLSQQREDVTDWRELVDSVMIDWNYDGAVLEPTIVDVPPEGKFVAGRYPVPPTAGTIRVKITDLLSQSLELEVPTHA